jgi:hypothetical protein
MAHKKGVVKSSRMVESKRLGVKILRTSCYCRNIIIRQRGSKHNQVQMFTSVKITPAKVVVLCISKRKEIIIRFNYSI